MTYVMDSKKHVEFMMADLGELNETIIKNGVELGQISSKSNRTSLWLFPRCNSRT